MDTFNQISAEYKKGFIDDVLNGMTPLLDNVQLRELNPVKNSSSIQSTLMWYYEYGNQ